MPPDAAAQRPASQPHVLDVARAFRAAARAVGFYPPTHQNVVAAIDQLMTAARAATGSGSMCLTVLPHGLMAGGAPLDPSEKAFADFAAICHRHGIGALILDGRATADSWRALLALLARKPEDVRAAGGVQRQWKALRHLSPAILELDFGALLRGQVGGDFVELAGVISHYLETAGVGGSILDDPCGALQRAVENAPDDAQAVAAVLRELRAAAQLTWAQPEQFDDVFRRAAAIGEFLTQDVMAALLERRGKPDAMVGSLDVVQALVERMPDGIISKFLTKAMAEEGAAASRITEVFTSLVPDAQRRRLIVDEAQDVALGADAVEQWAALQQDLDAHADRRFVTDQYVEEIQSARDRADRAGVQNEDPPERLEAWAQSIGDDAIRQTDLLMLADLARIEADPTRARRILEILQSNVLDAMNDADWEGVARTAEVLRSVASGAADGANRASAGEVLDRLAESPVAESVFGMLPGADSATSGTLVRALSAIGPALVPALVTRWAAERQPAPRARLEQVVVGCGRAGREVLRRLLASNAATTEVRVAAAHLLELTPGTEHLPILEAALSDPQDEVRNVAFNALARSSLDRAQDILARGIAKAEPPAQMALLDRLSALGSDRMLPVLRRAFSLVDPGTADLGVCLAMIATLGRAGGEGVRPLLTGAAGRTTWRSPLRAWRVRSAVKSALRALGEGVAPAAVPAAAGGEHSR